MKVLIWFKRNKTLMVFLSMVCIILIYTKDVVAQEDNQDKKIAVIDGTPIFQKDIRFNRVLFELEFKNLKGEELEKRKLQKEKLGLLGLIEEKIIEKKIKDMGIEVTNQEVRVELDKSFKKGLYDENLLKRIQKEYGLTVKALERWYLNPEEDKEIYQSELASIISPLEWEVYKEEYDTPEKLKRLKKMIPNSLAEWKENSFEPKKKNILFKKLRDEVIGQITVSEKELKKYYETKLISVWDIYHFFDEEREPLEKLRMLLMKGKNVKQSEREIVLTDLKKPIIYQIETIFNRPYQLYRSLPFYASNLPNMKKSDVGLVVEGPFSVEWETLWLKEKYLRLVKKEKTYYHLIQVIEIKNYEPPPEFSEVKKELIEKKRNEKYNKWMKEEIKKSITLITPKYLDILD